MYSGKSDGALVAIPTVSVIEESCLGKQILKR